MDNRQAGRRRGRGGQRQPGTGGGNNPRNNGNRIDNRARGNAAQLLEKYKNLAADAQRAGDRVNTEYYLQFADHYFRVLGDSRPRVEEQRGGRDDYADGDDSDFDGDNGSDAVAQERGNRDDRGQRDDRPVRAQRDDRGPREDRGDRVQRDDRGERAPREDRVAREDRAPREDRVAREDRAPREDRVAREDRAPREDRVAREDRAPREERATREDRAPREDRQPRERLRRDAGRSPAEDAGETMQSEGEAGTQANDVVEVAEVKAPRRRTPRPRVDAVAAAPAEANEPGEPTASIEADRLPPSLSTSDDGAERPRRRRRVRADEEAVPPVA